MSYQGHIRNIEINIICKSLLNQLQIRHLFRECVRNLILRVHTVAIAAAAEGARA